MTKKNEEEISKIKELKAELNKLKQKKNKIDKKVKVQKKIEKTKKTTATKVKPKKKAKEPKKKAKEAKEKAKEAKEKAKEAKEKAKEKAKEAKEKAKKKAEEEKEKEKTLEEELEEKLSDKEIEGFQIEKVNMEKLTHKVCDILAEQESKGMIQSVLWKKLKLGSRDGSRLALKLERMGMITREKILEQGRWTYKLIIKKTPISTVSIENAPCLTCPVEQKCSLDGEISPKTCQWIEDWVIAELKTIKKSQ